MHRAMFHRLIAVALVLFCAFPALGQFTRDKAANKKIDEAINTHYFATDFDKAEGVLLGTVEACGDKCSPQTLGRAWMYIGIVRGSGKKDMAGAKEAFSTAISLDANVKLDTDLASAETKAAFAEIGGSGGGATVAPPPGGGEDIGGEEVTEGDVGGAVPGGMTCTPDVTEMQTRRPVPVSCSSDAGAASVELRYKAFGEQKWAKVPLVKDGDYWQAQIPCEATADAGALRWYVQARAESGDVVDNFGTEQQPVVMTVTEDSAADPPAYPGQVAPERCTGMGSDAEICPPDFPGCGSGDKECGDKDWGASCDNSSECKCGLLCVDGACETAPSCESDSDCAEGTCVGGTCSVGGGGGDGPVGPYKSMWIGAHFAYDLGTVGGDDVCYSATQANGNFACFEGDQPYPNDSRGYTDPTSNTFFGEEPHTGTNIASGIAPGTMRALLSLDYALTPKITVGGRAGYALGGNPEDFLPVHAEARASYHILGLGSSFGPYVGVGAGLAQVDMKVSATMFNCSPKTAAEDPLYGMPALPGYSSPDANDPSGVSYDPGSGSYASVPSGRAYQECVTSSLGDQKQNLPKVPVDVYQKAGPIFAGGHLGGILRFGGEKNMGVQLNVNLMMMFPKQSFVIEPSLGFVYGM